MNDEDEIIYSEAEHEAWIIQSEMLDEAFSAQVMQEERMLLQFCEEVYGL